MHGTSSIRTQRWRPWERRRPWKCRRVPPERVTPMACENAEWAPLPLVFVLALLGAGGGAASRPGAVVRGVATSTLLRVRLRGGTGAAGLDEMPPRLARPIRLPAECEPVLRGR